MIGIALAAIPAVASAATNAIASLLLLPLIMLVGPLYRSGMVVTEHTPSRHYTS